MGLDIYVGSLTRYYTGDWLTAVQRFGQDSGIEVAVVRADPGPQDAVTDPAEVRAAVVDWQAGLAAGLGCAVDWPEGLELPYWSDKPAWDGYGAVVVAAAYEVEPDLRPGARRGFGWKRPKADDPSDWASAPAVVAAAKRPEPYVTLLSGVEWVDKRARFGLSVLLPLARLAREHRQPLLLDYQP